MVKTKILKVSGSCIYSSFDHYHDYTFWLWGFPREVLKETPQFKLTHGGKTGDGLAVTWSFSK